MSLIPEEGKIILINKELHWTSFDVVKKIRRVLKVKKVGHAGTLDPLATGLLIVCAGKMTKKISTFMDQEKEYIGSMIIGKTTPSVDLETDFDSEQSYKDITPDQIHALTKSFTGQIMQTPPIYSAIKRGGSPLYLKARKGEKVNIDPRPVEAKVFEIIEINLPEIRFRLICSKGFYVRSLVRDFGQALGVGAYMSALQRTRIGNLTVGDAQTIDEFTESVEKVGI